MNASHEHSKEPKWQRAGRPHAWMPYCQMQTAPVPLPVVETGGVWLTLADGRRLLDGTASWWTACHGYNYPHMVEAVERQLRRMPHVMFGGLQHEPALRLASRLAGVLPGDLNHVFFSDSGSVAVEVAMKMAVQFWLNQGARGRTRFVTFRHAYHGDTMGAMSLCDPVEGMHAHFAGFLHEQFVCDLPGTRDEAAEFDRFLGKHRHEVAGVFIEPLVQAAGGMKFHPPETLVALRESCRRHDVLLIADEIATGFGRTGTMFAIEQADVVPDIVCVGKALTGGMLGMAATIAGERVYDAFLSDDPLHALMHGPTFMANPLACAAANASLDLFEAEPRLRQVATIQGSLSAALQVCGDLPGVVDVRVKGAIGVIQVEHLRHVDRLKQRLVEECVWVRPFGDMIYVTPPLTISPVELAMLCSAVVRVTEEWAGWVE